MKILKYKKVANNKYKVILETGEDIVLYEDVILKYDLLINKEINDIDKIKDDNNNYLAYDIALKYLSKKMRCEYEIKEYLKKKELNKNVINKIVDKLKENGYIDNRLYTKCFIIDKINLNKYGQNKIKRELLKLKIDENIINEELNNINKEDIKNNLESLIDKKIKQIKSYSGNVLKQKILNDFINKGYYKEDILEILNKKDLSNNEMYDKEYNKLYKKYSKKYPEDQLEYIIKQKLYQKGFKKNNY